jgi:ribonuclease HI
MSEITIYCDGGSRGNGKVDSIGGWGAVLEYKGHMKELYGGKKGATNNQMELTGIIKALEALNTTHIPVRVHADSAYVVNGINEWVAGWKKKGWKKDKGEIMNLDLWKKLDRLIGLQDDIRVIKVKAHVGIEMNEIADALANKGMDEVE